MKWLPILCAAAAYWVLGFVWYSLLFGKVWAAALARHRGSEAAQPSGEMGAKLIGTFVSNLVAAAAMSYLFRRTGITDLDHAVRLGVAAGLGFAGTALTAAYIWQSKPTTVWFIDVGYNLVGCVIVALVLVSWP
jgi:hypothetical protein